MLRSEGVVLRAVDEGVIVEGNTITNTQFGIFVNGAKHASIRNNLIANTDTGSVIQAQNMVQLRSSAIDLNHISAFPDTGQSGEGCGVISSAGTGNDCNSYADNVVSDAFCGIAHAGTDIVVCGTYRNTVYATLNSDLPPETRPSFSQS